MYICATDSFWGAQGGDPDYPVEPGALYSGSIVARVSAPRRGVFAALDVTTNRSSGASSGPRRATAARSRPPAGSCSSAATTAGITALDKSNGKRLWEFQTDGGVNAPVVDVRMERQAVPGRVCGRHEPRGQQALRRPLAVLARRQRAIAAARLGRAAGARRRSAREVSRARRPRRGHRARPRDLLADLHRVSRRHGSGRRARRRAEARAHDSRHHEYGRPTAGTRCRRSAAHSVPKSCTTSRATSGRNYCARRRPRCAAGCGRCLPAPRPRDASARRSRGDGSRCLARTGAYGVRPRARGSGSRRTRRAACRA